MVIKTTEEFIIEARKIHGNNFDYSIVVYINGRTKVCIICPVHGEFWQTPTQHLKGVGCRKCNYDSMLKSNETFINECYQIHNDTYNYAKVIYKGDNKKVCIICNKCGNEFCQTPNAHLRGQGCPICKGGIKLEKKELMKRYNTIHGNKYDYSLVEYINFNTPICIICPKHGKFWQLPGNHMQGHGCKLCYNEKEKYNKLSQETVLERFKNKHNDAFDYSNVVYTNYETKVCIICKKCGDKFYQTPAKHMQGHGCSKCRGIGLTNEERIEKLVKVHGDRYDYSKVVYTRAKDPICIICREHGEFETTYDRHLSGGNCPKCDAINIYNKEDFVLISTEKHNGFYTYENTIFNGLYNEVIITCPIHGDFKQLPYNHIKGCGCTKCNKKHKYTTEEWVTLAKKEKGDIYDYSNVNYINAKTPVCIICPIHGEFWQTPNAHMSKNRGCPKCKKSKLEKDVYNLLQENNINFEEQKTFDWLRNPKTNYPLRLDFYLPEYNIAIECQGLQHYKVIDRWEKEKDYEKILYRDKIKKQLCEENSVKLSYYTNIKNIENTITSTDELLKQIK